MPKKTIEECINEIMIKRGFTGGWKEVEPIIKDTHLDADDIKRMVEQVAELYAYHSGLHDACTYEDKAFEDQKRYADIAEVIAKDRATDFASYLETRNLYLERNTIEQAYDEFMNGNTCFPSIKKINPND